MTNVNPVILALTHASKSAENTPAKVLERAARAIKAIPAGATDGWVSIFSTKIAQTGPELTDAEILACKRFADTLYESLATKPSTPISIPPIKLPAPIKLSFLAQTPEQITIFCKLDKPPFRQNYCSSFL